MADDISGGPRDVIEGGRRRGRGRLVILLVAGTVIVGLTWTVLLVVRGDGRSGDGRGYGGGSSPPDAPPLSARPVPTAPAGTPGTPVRNTFVPATRPAGGDKVVMPVTFPDGSTAEIRYPRALRIAQLGVRPVISGQIGDGAGRELFAPLGGDAWFAGGGGVQLRSLPAPGSRPVAVWRGNQASDFSTQYLVFTFGRWQIAVADDGAPEMLFEERTAWAAHLRGREAGGGFLVLGGTGPVRFAVPGSVERGESVGPQLHFGAPGGAEMRLVVAPDCRVGEGVPHIGGPRPAKTGTACRGSVLVAVAGDVSFVDGVLHDLRVEEASIRS